MLLFLDYFGSWTLEKSVHRYFASLQRVTSVLFLTAEMSLSLSLSEAREDDRIIGKY